MRYISGGAEELAKAALEGAKLGMDLRQMTKISDKLLDIESSLTAQFEFQALSGREINLDKARELALTGDIVGASKEVLDAVGSAADFNAMSRFEKEKLAEATGMEVSELAKTLTLQDKLGDLSKEQAAAAKSLGLSAEEMKAMSDEDLATAIAKQQSTEKAGKAFEDMVNTIKTALLPIAEVVTEVIGSLSPILNMIMIPVKLIGKVFGVLLNDLGPISSLLKGIAGFMILKWTYTKLTAGKGGFGGLVGKIGASVKNMFSFNKEAKTAADTTKKVKDNMQGANDETKSLGDRFKGLKGKMKGLGQSIKTAFSSKGGMKGLGKNLVGGLSKGAKGVGGFLKGNLGNIAGGAAMMGGTALMSGGIPGFANGGEVGSTGIAKVHEGEMITPASKVPGSEPDGGNGGGIDYDKMTQAFIAALQQMPAPQINMDGKRISESVSAQQSYDRGIK